MVAVFQRSGTINSIDDKEEDNVPKRGYLGMSGIGDSCWRKIWYSFHWVSIKGKSQRIKRIFRIGHMFEQMAIEDLKNVGCFVYRVDENGLQQEMTGAVGEEQEELIGFAGHAKGHPDGRITGLEEYPHSDLLLELKTMNDNNFNEFKKMGIKRSHPIYYSQCQKYMGKMNLSKCFFLAINKNTCEYRWEFIELNNGVFQDLERKEQIIIISDSPPERAHESDSKECGYCDFFDQCYAGAPPEKNCRTCEHCDMQNDGIWTCSKKDNHNGLEYELNIEEQWNGCDLWEKGWEL